MSINSSHVYTMFDVGVGGYKVNWSKQGNCKTGSLDDSVLLVVGSTSLLTCLVGTILSNTRSIVESAHHKEAAEACHTHGRWGPSLLTLCTWCWFLFCPGLVACDMFPTDFHETANVSEIVPYSASHSHRIGPHHIHAFQTSLSCHMYMKFHVAFMNSADIAYSFCVWYVMCDRYSHDTAQKSLGY